MRLTAVSSAPETSASGTRVRDRKRQRKFRKYTIGVAKSDPFSIRLSKVTDDLVSQEALRTRRYAASPSGAPTGTGARGNWERRSMSGRSFAPPARRAHPSSQAMADTTDLSDAQVRLALAHAAEFPDEIDDAIAEAERPLAELQLEFPTLDTVSAE